MAFQNSINDKLLSNYLSPLVIKIINGGALDYEFRGITSNPMQMNYFLQKHMFQVFINFFTEYETYVNYKCKKLLIY